MLIHSAESISMESLVLYPNFYRLHGIRRAVQLVAPPLSPLSKLALPASSILHYVSTDEALYGMPQEEPILRDIPRLLMTHHVQELGDVKGQPRSTRLPPNSMILDYHRKNRLTRRLNSYDTALRDPRTPIVENYGLLPHLWRYTTSYFRGYYKWWNIQAAVWNNVEALSRVTDRQQYLQCRLPKILPSMQLLKRGEQQMSRTLLDAFVEPESLFILEIWKWLGENRDQSVLAKATPKALAKMNLIWIESGVWFVMNLGMLDSWRVPDGKAPTNGQLSPDALQKRFLRLMMHLFEVRTSPEAAKDTVVKIQIPAGQDQKAKTITLKPDLDVDSLPEHPVEETPENIEAIDKAITADLDGLDHLHVDVPEEQQGEEPKPRDDSTPVINYTPQERSVEKSVMDKVDRLADAGLVSGAEYRRFTAISTLYQKLDNPYGEGKLVEAATVKPEELKLDKASKIPDIDTVVDKSMLQSSLLDFDRRYINDVLKKDVLSAVLGIQHAGIAVTEYEVTPVEDAMGASEIHRVQFTPVEGKPSTLTFRIPKVNEDGTFRSNGVRYRMRKQRGDVPIRKLGPNRVALTSYYAKVFLSRSEKQVHNYAGWLTNRIAAMSMDPTNTVVTNCMLSDVFDSTNRTPRLYSTMAQRFRSFHSGPYQFFFDYKAREAHFGEELVAKAEQGGAVIIGKTGPNAIVVGQDEMLYVVKDDTLEPLGSMASIVGLEGTGPLEMVELKVFGKLIPVGLVLSYHLGLTQLCKVLGVTPRRVPTGERLNLSEDEFALRFEDEALVFSRDHRLAALILGGFAQYEKQTRNYQAHLFDRKDIYLNVLEQNGIGVRYLREVDLMNELFVDPITEELLKEMKEPTDFIGLLIRGSELLLTDWAPAETDMEYMRVKGYERVAGAIYGQLVQSVRQQRARGPAAKAKLELPPYAVWQAITQDPAVKVVEESNPVHNVKEMEELTYTGVGGRSERSMSANTRVFHKNDLGIISEATKDSADVAITTFLTADPNLTSLRGLSRRHDFKQDGPTKFLSSSAMLAPAADRDDPKRVNFISIQQSSGTFAEGYRPTPLRTGYEQVLAHRCDDLYAYTAKADGKVTAVTPRAIVITYDDGTSRAVELGRRFGSVAGVTFPHELTTSLKVGDVVKAGDVVAYNSHYFEPDTLNPSQVLWKAGVLVKTAIMESVDTLEDSSAISERVADLMSTKITKVRDIVVGFDQEIHKLLEPGTEVDVESILCTIEDAVSAQNQLFDESSLDTLRLISANTPRAKFKGTVERVEVFYHGELDDASESIAELAATSDRERKRAARDLKTTYTSGQVNDSMRVEGRSLPHKHAVIRVYITGRVGTGVGDKGVFGNQMKTIFGRVMSGINRTASGEDIDAIFGYTSINDRIILSPEVIGTTNTLLKVMSKRVVDVYEGN